MIPTKEQTLLEAYKQWRERADPKVCCDYGLHVAITHWNEQVAADMETLAKEQGLKTEIHYDILIFFVYSLKVIINDRTTIFRRNVALVLFVRF